MKEAYEWTEWNKSMKQEVGVGRTCKSRFFFPLKIFINVGSITHSQSTSNVLRTVTKQ